jgi:hypothetical protein
MFLEHSRATYLQHRATYQQHLPRFKVAKGRSTLIRQPEPDLTPNLQQYQVTPSMETQVVRRKIQ